MFSVATYKPYFDVDTTDVVERIWESVFPFRGTFTEKTSEKPDLYASFALPPIQFVFILLPRSVCLGSECDNGNDMLEWFRCFAGHDS